MSAARQRLSKVTGAPSTRPGGHLSMRRALWYSLIVAALLAAAFAIAFTLHWPGVTRFYDRPGKARA
ncbi:MAG: hypothetical protein ABSH25_16750 [Syntrophorhabdales bacterium]